MKEEYRRDLHQILAYSSFSQTSFKYSFLCYPSTSFECNHVKYYNELNGVTNSIFILGLPIKKSLISEIKNHLLGVISRIEKEDENTR